MAQKAEVQVTLTTEAKLAALDAYQRKVQSVTSMVGGLKTVLAGLGAATAVGSLAGGFQAATQHLNTLSTEIARSAGRVGVSAEAYQVFGHVLKSAGGDAADLTTALSTLRNALGEALRNGDSGFAKAFAELGLKVADLTKLRPEIQLERVARALAGIEDPARRASLAQDILGKGASNLKPVLDRLAVEGFGGLRDEVAATAGIMSGEMARALDDLETRIASAGNRMALALSPLVLKTQELKARLAETAAGITETVAGGASWAAEQWQKDRGVGWGAVAAQGIGGAALLGVTYRKEIKAGWDAAVAGLAKMPAWGHVGTLIGLGAVAVLAGANTISGLTQAAVAGQELDEVVRAAPLDRVKEFNTQFRTVDSQEKLQNYAAEAERRAREAARRSFSEQDPELKRNLEQAAKQYWGIVHAAKAQGDQLIRNNLAAAQAKRDAELNARAAEMRADREKDAAEWVEKNAKAMTEQTEAGRRKLELSQLDPVARLAQLERERVQTLDNAAEFTGTESEKRRNQVETERAILALDEEIAATRKEITAQTDKELEARLRIARLEDPGRAHLKEVSPEDYSRGVDIAASMEMERLQRQAGRDSANFLLTDEEKRRRRIENLRAQQGVLDESASALRAGGDAQRAQQFEDRSGVIGGQIEGAASPQTTLEGFGAGLTQLQNQWGTLAQQMQRSVADIGQGITQGIGGGLNQILGTTEYWSQSLGNIAGPIMGSITQSISRMFAEWIVARGAAAIKNIAFSQKEGAADAIAKAPGALFGSISSFGVAAAVGVAAFIAATALTGGFRTGGYTGGNDASAPAGVVHQGEWVAPKWMVDDPRYSEMISTLEAIRSGQAGFSLGGFVKYGGMPKEFWGKQVSGFMDRYNFVDGSKLYPSAVGQDATFDAASQQWIQNPDQSVAVPSALTPSPAFAGSRGGSGDDDGSDPAVKPMRVAIFDESSKDAYDQFVSDPRYETAVVRFSRKNAKRLWGGQTG